MVQCRDRSAAMRKFAYWFFVLYGGITVVELLVAGPDHRLSDRGMFWGKP